MWRDIFRECCDRKIRDRMFNIISYSTEIILFRETNIFPYFATTAILTDSIDTRHYRQHVKVCTPFIRDFNSTKSLLTRANGGQGS